MAAYAEEAIQRAGLTMKKKASAVVLMAAVLVILVCPAPIFLPVYKNIHSKLEWIGTKDMAKAAETIVHVAMIWEERS